MKLSDIKIPKVPPIPKLGIKRITTFDTDEETKATVAIVACFCMALITFLAVLGIAGRLGNTIGEFLRSGLGRASFIIPVFFLYGAYELIKAQYTEKGSVATAGMRARMLWGIGIIMIGVAGMLAWGYNVLEIAEIGRESRGGSGGFIGFIVHLVLHNLVGRIGAFFVIIGIISMGIFVVSSKTFVEFIEAIREIFTNPKSLWDKVPDFFAFLDKPEPVINGEILGVDKKEDLPIHNIPNVATVDKITPFQSRIVDSEIPKTTKTKKVFNFKTEHDDGKVLEMEGVEEYVENYIPKSGRKSSAIGWTLPSFDLLSNVKNTSEGGDIETNKNTIKSTLSHFNISVEMKSVTVGPTVSQYTLEPASGVRLSSIDALSRDLALALAAINIRIEAPIPGKKLVGVEIPNIKKETVRLRDIIQTKEFLDYSDDLPIAIGKDVTGKNLLYPLSKMPHLLVAGATGAGKSVWINGLLLSLLYRYSPSQLGLILVDMKRVELKLYDGVPHLLTPVITDAEKAINSLKWTVLEMDKRYKVLEETGKRNIRDYNKYADTIGIERMSYIVYVIDELGDLMMLAKNEVEPIIVRLTQMSRAVGIHIVLGTQRPDTQVVTGLIKANIPTRIAFAVASQIDSRVILDQVGAEKLLGQGDGMIVTPSDLGAKRFQGAYVDDVEIRKCVNFLRDQAIANNIDLNYLDEVTQKPQVKINIPGMREGKNDGDEDGIDQEDSAYEKAKALVVQYQKASTSFLQNRMGIGYPKASKIIMQLEEEGIVGPANGSKPRDVYLQPLEGLGE
jgi:DNA segregation ATPase FtsK/SpoIIIE, S-DNA-T family